MPVAGELSDFAEDESTNVELVAPVPDETLYAEDLVDRESVTLAVLVDAIVMIVRESLELDE